MLSLSNHLHSSSRLQRNQQNMEWEKPELIVISEQNYKATVECSALVCLKMRSTQLRSGFPKMGPGK